MTAPAAVPIHEAALLTQGDAAAYCRVSRRVMAEWVTIPGFPLAHLPHLVRPRIPRLALDAWLAAHTPEVAA